MDRPPQPEPFKLLYVEDESDTREIIARNLAADYPHLQLYVAVNGAEGLELFRAHRPEVVITDIAMPVMDGLRMAAEIRALEPEAELIALTAYSDTAILVNAIEIGFSHYILKPIDLDKLWAALEKSLGIVRLKHQVQVQHEQLRVLAEELEQRVAQLESSEERFRATFNQAAVGIGHMAPDGTFLRINRKYCDIVGCEPEEMQNLSIKDFTHPDDLEKTLEQYHLLLARKIGSYTMEKRYIHRDGSTVWVSLTASLVCDHDGAPSFVVGVIQDITDRKRSEEERERLLVQLEAVLDSISEGVVIADMQGKVLTMNRSALALHEYQSVEQIRQQLHRFEETFEITTLNQQVVPLEEWPLARALRGERFTSYEVCIHNRNTGRWWIGSYSGTPVRTKSDETILALITIRDITERRQAEEALRKSELKLSRIFHSVPAAIAITTLKDARCVEINEAGLQMLGYQREEILGQSLLDLGAWESQASRDRMLRELDAKGKVRDFEVRLRSKDGSMLIVLFSAEPIELDGQRHLLSIVRDITQRKRMEEQIERLNRDLAARAHDLEDANRELEAFSYTVAHDLRKPLTVISGYCQAMRELCGTDLDEECRSYIHEAHKGTRRMNQLIDSLLDFSRASHGELKRQVVDISVMAAEVAAELEQAEPGRNVTCRIEPGITTEGDPALLRVVLANLLGNAWKYTIGTPAALIEFGVKELEGRPAFFVRDNGPGFDMAEARDLFVPFRRLPSGERVVGGLGIGLAAVERIIRRHGGKVWAEAEPGRGATFYFTLSAG